MAHKSSSHHVEHGQTKRPLSDAAAKGIAPDIERTATTSGLTSSGLTGLPAHPSAKGLRQNKVLQLQKIQGNRNLQRSLATVQRDGEEDTPAAPRVFPVGGLSISEKLPGYGLIPTVQRAPAATEKVKSHVALTTNAPGMIALPAAAIGAGHGRPDAVGWTTPMFNVQVTYADEQNVHVKVTLDFSVELPIDYDSDAAAVVIDHELGHVRIGERKAQKHLVDEVKAEFEKLDKIENPGQIQTILQGGAQKFKDAEKEASNQYDNTDYARMTEAYQGVRKSLSELSSKSAAIAQMAGALGNVKNRLLLNLKSYDFSAVEALCDAAIGARGALNPQELARLQYNKEFQALVAVCKGRLQATHQYDLLIGVDPDSIPDGTKSKIAALEGNLGSFTFSPSGATASY